MVQLFLMFVGYGSGIYYLGQGLGHIKIKKSDEMDVSELAKKKKTLIFSSFIMFAIGIIYTLEFLGFI